MIKLVLPLSKATLACGNDKRDAIKRLIRQNYLDDKVVCEYADEPVHSYVYHARYVLRVLQIVNVLTVEI